MAQQIWKRLPDRPASIPAEDRVLSLQSQDAARWVRMGISPGGSPEYR
jgi:hypothetical protein